MPNTDLLTSAVCSTVLKTLKRCGITPDQLNVNIMGVKDVGLFSDVPRAMLMQWGCTPEICDACPSLRAFLVAQW